VRLLLPLEQRYYRADDGNLYSADPATYDYLQKFLAVFDDVTVLARVRDGQRPFNAAQRANGPNVDFALLPDFRTPAGCLANASTIRRLTNEAVASTDAVLMRVPGIVSEIARRAVLARGGRYGVHVVGDPVEVFATGASASPLRFAYKTFFTRQVRRACRDEANAVAYVSRHTLPQRYPVGEGIPTFVLSNVDLHGAIASHEVLAQRSARLRSRSRLNIGVVAYLDAHYKGIDVLLQALRHCREKLDFHCTIAGEGVLKEELIKLGRELGVADRLTFAGHVEPRRKIFEFLDTVDLYVQPSRTEGLPRALIEAMARGCAAIGSHVGGIPELLHGTELVAPNNAVALAEKIMEIGKDPERMCRLGQANVEAARAYEGPRLDAIRLNFLRAIRESSSGIAQGATC
jgi:glycosyltransferase involved in cell wall biosynthesis